MMKMLQHIKQMLPDGWSRTRRALGMNSGCWQQIGLDQTVCFGAMAQTELNQAKLLICASKEYEFPQGRFTAYQLWTESKPQIWLIVAGTEGDTPYLAISRKLSRHDLEDLLAAEDLQVITHSSRLKHLLLRGQTPGLRDWITLRYERRIEGIRGKQHENGTERVFEYELYVSEQDSHAIEVERYLDGHMDAYATIYRPVTDILEVMKIARKLPPEPVAPEVLPSASVRESAPTPQKIRPSKPTSEASLKDVEQTRKIIQQPAVVKASTSPRSNVAGRVECDISTAWRLIDEALRGGMHLSDVVRKVLGLPLHASDLISFDFTLTDEDYEALARRYGLNPQNQMAIRARMIQELEAFAGKGTK